MLAARIAPRIARRVPSSLAVTARGISVSVSAARAPFRIAAVSPSVVPSVHVRASPSPVLGQTQKRLASYVRSKAHVNVGTIG